MHIRTTARSVYIYAILVYTCAIYVYIYAILIYTCAICLYIYAILIYTCAIYVYIYALMAARRVRNCSRISFTTHRKTCSLAVECVLVL